MKTQSIHLILSGLCLMLIAMAARAAEVPVVLAPDASQVERLAAQDLTDNLARLYPRDRFILGANLPATGKAIVLGKISDARVRAHLPGEVPIAPEGYCIRAENAGGLELGVIAGADAYGVAYGVYGLLEKLGCGFYLSGDIVPAARNESLSFKNWDLADKPLVQDRLVFDWHNFLSGCSTWNLPDWRRWTAQSQKMGYNAIMVHAYGNNPMVSFDFNGKTKPVGYLSTTVKGRDWSTMHVNDVRRLFGGAVFDSPVFGADAAQVPEGKRAEAARKLMQGVFAHAAERGMNVFFADDVDTISANPQELIASLPASARFATGSNGAIWLANPDTQEGYRYYKAQVVTLLSDYPQITSLVAWFRNGGTPWLDLKAAEMPAAWQEEYKAAITRRPEVAKFPNSVSMFAIGKIVGAFERALKELGHDRVRLAAGTWNFAFLQSADVFFPSGIPLIGLDYGTLFNKSNLATPESRQKLAEVGAHRPVIPVIWAHHDDGAYIGRPFIPFADFNTKLTEAKAGGFGIIHWTTRPLDLFFSSHIRQVWERTQNEPLRGACDEMAARALGDIRLGEYLERWATGAPIFGRETSDDFIDRPLLDVDAVVSGCRERIALLGSAENDRANYFRGLEQFIAAFHETHGLLQRSQAALKSKNLDEARRIMAQCHPEAVIEQFAKLASSGITRGEQGLIVTLNTRWLVYYIRQRQMLGMEPIRYNFGPTSHDKLAQAPGHFTYFFDVGQKVWQTLGEEETGASIFTAASASDEIARHGVESDKPFTFTLRPIVRKAALPAAHYQVRLLLFDPDSTAEGQRVFTVSVGATSSAVDIFKEAGGAKRMLEKTYPVTLRASGEIAVTLTPVEGKAVISGAVLERK